MTVDTLTVTGVWVCPADVTSVQVECWGAGGGSGGASCGTGGSNVSGGAGAGAYAKKNALTVVPGVSYTVTVGVGGTPGISSSAGGPGGDTWFSTALTVLAKGGLQSNFKSDVGGDTNGGVGGDSASCIGDTVTSGANGGSGPQSSPDPTVSKAGGASPNGGAGGVGVSAANNSAATGTTGTSPGGGAGGSAADGGASGQATPGGTGARGEIKLTYTAVPTPRTATETVIVSNSVVNQVGYTKTETIAVSDSKAKRDGFGGQAKSTTTWTGVPKS